MTTSGTYSFEPANGSLVLNAFDRIQIRPTSLLMEHMQRAMMESNLLLSEWSNRGVNLWKSELQTVTLSQGVSNYTLPKRTVSILVAYISQTINNVSTDRIITPISTYEWGAIPNKTLQGFPTIYWFNRQITPQINIWNVPNLDNTYVLKLQTMVQVEDNNLTGAQTPDVPYRWYDCMVAGLAYRLARVYAPALEDKRKMDYAEAWGFAASEDTEDVPVYIFPGLSAYYR